MDIEASAAQSKTREKQFNEKNLTIVYAIEKRFAAAAVRYLIILHVFSLHLS
jgi:hypothetical protein